MAFTYVLSIISSRPPFQSNLIYICIFVLIVLYILLLVHSRKQNSTKIHIQRGIYCCFIVRGKWALVILQWVEIVSVFALKNSFAFSDNTCQHFKLSEFQESATGNRKFTCFTTCWQYHVWLYVQPWHKVAELSCFNKLNREFLCEITLSASKDTRSDKETAGLYIQYAGKDNSSSFNSLMNVFLRVRLV